MLVAKKAGKHASESFRLYRERQDHIIKNSCNIRKWSRGSPANMWPTSAENAEERIQNLHPKFRDGKRES